MTTINTHRITVTALKADNRGQPYSVSFNGETIIAKSHVPSHDACRYLTERGLTGPLEVWATGEAFARSRFTDLVKAAKWTVSESASRSVRFTRYVPFSDSKMHRELANQGEAG